MPLISQAVFDLQGVVNLLISFSGKALVLLSGLLLSAGVFRNGEQMVTVVSDSPYILGLGIGDITGPVVETNMMGYAMLRQVDTGLHMRQRSRAFIVADAQNSTNRVLFINSDIGMGDTGVRRSIISELIEEFSGLYENENVAFVGTHSHAGVGGYLENLLPQVTSKGYVNQSAQAIVTGTLAAIRRAHESMAPGRLSVGSATIIGGNINRSPYAYLQNPAEERARYRYNIDKDMSLLRFDDPSGNARGFLSFFPVHGTSLYNNNTLISGDNKGMAAYLYEHHVEPEAMPGNTTFVAGFVQSNVGDTSPNTLGAFCESPGKPYDGQLCDFEQSTCGNATQDCRGRGPGYLISDFESNRIIADKQFQGAKTIMEHRVLKPIKGPVASVHVYMNMSFRSFILPNGMTVQTCPPAFGFSFAGGTSDGPGAFDFVQGDNGTSHNPFWEIVKGAVTPRPSDDQIACHAPKPILLNSGYAHSPYEWSPNTVDVQMFRIGIFVILVVPGEFTTMAGRRIREAVQKKLISEGILQDDVHVVIAGPSNTYAHYITTPEEYSVQRYEGASTLYGPFTLDAYIDKYTSLVPYLVPNASITLGSPHSDPPPDDQSSKAISLQKGVVRDGAAFKKFGQVLEDVDIEYNVGETVVVQFVGANPRNNLRLDQSFLTVDRQLSDGEWQTVRSDSHPSTIYQWERTDEVLGTSTVTISWSIEQETPAGTYRIQYFGDSKSITGKITQFVGTSTTFEVVR